MKRMIIAAAVALAAVAQGAAAGFGDEIGNACSAIGRALTGDWRHKICYRGLASTGWSGGKYTPTYRYNIWALETTQGVQLIPQWLFVGAGAAWQVYAPAEDWTFSFPVFGELRSHFTRTRLSPFIDVKCGYTFPVDLRDVDGGSSTSGGLFVMPSAGVSFRVTRVLDVELSLGYHYQASTQHYPYTGSEDYIREKKKNLGGPTLRMGVSW